MKKLAFIAAALVAAPSLLTASPVFAASPGQLSDSTNNYLVKNVTKNTANSTAVSATCNETLKYTIELANSEFGLIRNITVKANLNSGDMTASGTNSANVTTSTSGHVNVTLDKGSLVYIPGSTVLTPVDSSTRQLGASVTKADGITAGGLNVGDLNGSTREYVQFQAKVVCDVAPVVPVVPVAPVVPAAPVAPKAPEAPKALGIQAPAVIAATGPASTIATMFGLSALAASIAYFVQRRRNILG